MSFGGGPCHDLSHLTLTLFAVFINLGMAVLQEHLSVAASVSNPYCFCVMRYYNKRFVYNNNDFRSDICFYILLRHISGAFFLISQV